MVKLKMNAGVGLGTRAQRTSVSAVLPDPGGAILPGHVNGTDSYVSVPRSRHCSSGTDRSDEAALFRDSDARRLLVDSTQDNPYG